MTPAHQPTMASILADQLVQLGAKFDDVANCIMVLIDARWMPVVIDMHIDEAIDIARSGVGLTKFRRAA